MATDPSNSMHQAFIVTGPTSGYGFATAQKLARQGTLILVGRDRARLLSLQKDIETKGGAATTVVCDLSDMASVRNAAKEIIALGLPVAGLLHNAGVQQMTPTVNKQGWDMSYATNALGPFLLTKELLPHLADGTTITFVVSAVEDPERPSAKMAGFRGGRYISAEASARAEWKAGGAKRTGYNAYATSKQVALVNALELAEENPRLYVNAVEPGFSPTTGLGREAPAVLRWVARHVFGIIAPLIKGSTTVNKASSLLTRLLLNQAKKTGVYFDEKGESLQPSEQVRDTLFRQRVLQETRAFLAAHQC